MLTGALLLLGGWAVAEPEAMKTESDRVQTTQRVVETPIEFPVKFRFDRSMRPGQARKVQDGVNGVNRSIYRVTMRDGKPVSKNLERREVVEAVPAVFLMGRSGYAASRGNSFRRTSVMMMESTAYTPYLGDPRRISRRTANGTLAQLGVVAVDPRVIPLGTLLFVEGYGFAIAADTGGAIRGRKIDVCLPTTREAIQWGRRTVRVHILQRIE